MDFQLLDYSISSGFIILTMLPVGTSVDLDTNIFQHV